jgi:hypothetical protein
MLHTDIYKARRFYSYYHYNLLKDDYREVFLGMAVGMQLCYRETTKSLKYGHINGGLLFLRRN